MCILQSKKDGNVLYKARKEMKENKAYCMLYTITRVLYVL